MANKRRGESGPAADSEFEQFLQWRAQCHAQSQRLEAMEDGQFPAIFRSTSATTAMHVHARWWSAKRIPRVPVWKRCANGWMTKAAHARRTTP